MIPVEARLLRVYVNGSDHWHGQPLYRAIVEAARALPLAGASVFAVELAYGTHRRLRDTRSEYTSADIPVVVEIVDAPDRVDALLDRLRPMVAEGFATVEPVRVIRYAAHEDRIEPEGR